MSAELLDAAHSENLSDQVETSECIAFMRFLVKAGIVPDGFSVAVDEAINAEDVLLRVHGATMENRVCAMCDYLVTRDSVLLGELRGDIVDVRREVRLPCGIADRVLTHSDGSLTAVEVKRRGSRRDYACGLGQAIMYAASLREMPCVPDVRAALCIEGLRDEYIAAACQDAGVTYINIPDGVAKTISDYAVVAASVSAR